jgi:hypothetical protein
VWGDGGEGPGRGSEQPRRHARRPMETRGPGGDGGPSGMVGDLCPVGLRQHRGRSRRRAAEKGQAVLPGTGARRSAMLSEGGRGGGGEPSGATSVRRGQGGAKRGSRQSRGKTGCGGADSGSAVHTRGPWPNVPQQRRSPGKEVSNWREPAARQLGPSVLSDLSLEFALWSSESTMRPGILLEILLFCRESANGGWIGAMQGAG